MAAGVGLVEGTKRRVPRWAVPGCEGTVLPVSAAKAGGLAPLGLGLGGVWMSKFPEVTLVGALGSADVEDKRNTCILLALRDTVIASSTSGSPSFREADGDMDEDSDSEARLSGLAFLLGCFLALLPLGRILNPLCLSSPIRKTDLVKRFLRVFLMLIM